MVKLLVIADDFTGALDTGVQFRARDSLVVVYKPGDDTLSETMQKDIQVLVIDTETRHLPPKEAYDTVFAIIRMAVQLGICYIYKKTDSGMRGNIGSELAAFYDASGGKNIHFIPAFPQMGRTTRNGVHYINGVPVSESIFGKDLFEPVRKSAVKDIIGEQSGVPVCLMGEEVSREPPEGILVYDSTTEAEMARLAVRLKEEGQLHLLAGCAGFAALLFDQLGIEARKSALPVFKRQLLTVCGSINAVTARQLDYAAGRGACRLVLTPEQKLEKGWADSPEGVRTIASWMAGLPAEVSVIVECGVHDTVRTAQYAQRRGLDLAEARCRIADNMGGILKQLLNDGLDSTLLVTGGDTLLAFMQHIHQNALVPICEILPGVVLSQFQYRDMSYNLLSKSGGFGQEDLLLQLERRIKQQRKGMVMSHE